MRPPHARNRDAEQGFILIAVLWILAAIAGLVGMYAVYVSTTARSTLVYAERLRMDEAIQAAVEMTAFRLVGTKDPGQQPAGAFAFPLGAFFVTVAYRPETARIDINAASRTTLANLFTALGAKPPDASYYADRIVGWRGANPEAGISAEAAAYAAAGLPYGPREGLFQSVDELWIVLGLPAWLVQQSLPYVTVFSGRADVDARFASALAAGAANTSSPDGETAPTTPGMMPAVSTIATPPASAEPDTGTARPKAIRASISVMRNGVAARTADVVLLFDPDGERPYDVLSWHDE
jgi:general secretion pathway protein K